MMTLLYKSLFSGFLILFLTLPNAFAIPLDLGLAEDFNGFVLGDVTVTGGDSEGRLAIGGDLNANPQWGSYSVGFGRLGMGGDYVDPVLDVAGTVSGRWIANGTAAIGQDSTVDYHEAGTYLKSQSRAWGQLEGNSQVSMTYGTLEMTGTNPDLNIFTVDGALWSQAHTKRLDIAEGSRALINISGTTVTNRSSGFFIDSGNGLEERENILFNYFEATAVVHYGFAQEGSVLSPFAHWDASGGGINGKAVLGSLYGHDGFEFHSFGYNNGGTSPNPVPEPSAGVLLALGCLFLAGLARAKRS